MATTTKQIADATNLVEPALNSEDASTNSKKTRLLYQLRSARVDLEKQVEATTLAMKTATNLANGLDIHTAAIKAEQVADTEAQQNKLQLRKDASTSDFFSTISFEEESIKPIVEVVEAAVISPTHTELAEEIITPASETVHKLTELVVKFEQFKTQAEKANSQELKDELLNSPAALYLKFHEDLCKYLANKEEAELQALVAS